MSRTEPGGRYGTPVPQAFRSALDDQADGADLDHTAGQLMPECRDYRLGGLPGRAIGQGDVRRPGGPGAPSRKPASTTRTGPGEGSPDQAPSPHTSIRAVTPRARRGCGDHAPRPRPPPGA